MLMRTFIFLVSLTSGFLHSCRVGKAVSSNYNGDTTLRAVVPFRVGVSVSPRLLASNKDYYSVVTKEFSSLTPENAGKLSALRADKDRWDFSGLDSIVALANNYKIRVHGHTLIWHSFEKVKWLREFEGDSAAWEALFKDHIQTTVTRYKGRIASWDVVNEALRDDGGIRIQNTSDTMKEPDGSIWARKLGTGYIERAFLYAHEADPGAKLFYNDYALESRPQKLDSVLAMIKRLRVRGVPVHGIGTQTHIGVSASEEGLRSCISKLAATGLLVHISELDILVSDWVNKPDLEFTPALAQKQSDKYGLIARLYKELVPAAQQHGITIWNVGDGDSWIRNFMKLNDWPVLFDEQYNKKKAYYGFLDGLKNK